MTSFRSQILHRTLRRVVDTFAVGVSIQEQRTRMDALARRGIRVPLGIDVCPQNAAGIHSEWIQLRRKECQRTILYLHGGGYCICSLDTHRGLGARLVLASDARLLMPAYRLAPEHPFPAALEDALTAYRWLLQQGIPSERIAIGGDSAGGGLALSTAVSLRASGEPLPAALFLFSPWTDLTFSGESHHTRKPYDPIFGGDRDVLFTAAYLGKEPADNPLISPLFADLHGLPPTLIHVGEDEILLDDSTLLEKKLVEAGVKVELKVWPGMWHVFQAFAPFLPEAQASMDQVGDFLLQHVQVEAE